MGEDESTEKEEEVQILTNEIIERRSASLDTDITIVDDFTRTRRVISPSVVTTITDDFTNYNEKEKRSSMTTITDNFQNLDQLKEEEQPKYSILSQQYSLQRKRRIGSGMRAQRQSNTKLLPSVENNWETDKVKNSKKEMKIIRVETDNFKNQTDKLRIKTDRFEEREQELELEFDSPHEIASIWGAEIVGHEGTRYRLRALSLIDAYNRSSRREEVLSAQRVKRNSMEGHVSPTRSSAKVICTTVVGLA